MTAAPQRRFPWWAYWIALSIILVVAPAPVLSVIVAGSVAEANGCTLDERSVHPCVVNGEDIGSTLYALGMMGWLMLASLPLGAGALLLWGVVLIVHRLYWGRKQRGGAPNG